ncbi:MAG: response regulator transcription factor [Bacteroidaceae bacterium]|jgi:DNA-binding CsgD family transcriptional regulator
MMEKPRIAIVGGNALENLGLKALLDKMVPFVNVEIFSCLDDLVGTGEKFFHFFVTPTVLIENPVFFVRNQKKTIVLMEKEEKRIPKDFHEIDVSTYQTLLRELLRLVYEFHHNYERFPDGIAQTLKKEDADNEQKLTPREIEVLKAVAMGCSSKEIAEKLNISLSTVLSHRKNLMEKLKLHSATKLVIYAVMHGLVKPDEIK